MVSFNADITNPPSVNSSRLGSTVKNWAGYIVVAAMMFFALGIAQNSVMPLLQGTLGNLLGVNSGASTGPIQFGDP